MTSFSSEAKRYPTRSVPRVQRLPSNTYVVFSIVYGVPYAVCTRFNDEKTSEELDYSLSPRLCNLFYVNYATVSLFLLEPLYAPIYVVGFPERRQYFSSRIQKISKSEWKAVGTRIDVGSRTYNDVESPTLVDWLLAGLRRSIVDRYFKSA